MPRRRYRDTMRRLITWSFIILVFGLGLVWMVNAATANPRTLPKTVQPSGTTGDQATPTEPSLSERAGTAAREAVDKAKEVGTQVVEKSGEIATQVSEATKEAAAKTGDAAQQATEKAKQAAGEFTEGFNKPVEPAKP